MEKHVIGEIRDFPADWQQVAFVDSSDGWDIDQTAIYFTPEGFVLATASGCSCWDGEWYASRYNSVGELLTDLGPEGEAEYTYQPTFEGVKNLRAQVEEWQAGR